MSLKLHVLVTSTRPTRVGPAIGKWFHQKAVEHGAFDAELVDLAAYNLPVFDEPHHPRLQNYQHAHTRAWSAKVKEADAIAFVLPEYNYNPPSSFVNAVDYLVKEWAYMPVGFVSYGGVSGGLRAVQGAKPLVTTLKMMPVPEGVAIPNFGAHLDEAKAFKSNELIDASVAPMLDELHRWADVLKDLRKSAKA